VGRDYSGTNDPLEALVDHHLSRLDDDVTVLEAPRSTTINGQPAATALLSSPTRIRTWEDEPVEARIQLTVVGGPDQSVFIEMISVEGANEQWQSVFEQMLQGVAVGARHSPPAIGERREPPPDYTYYEDPETDLGFAHPAHWQLASPPELDEFQTVLLSDPGDPACSVSIIAVSDEKAPELVDIRLGEFIGSYFEHPWRAGRIGNVVVVSEAATEVTVTVERSRVFLSSAVNLDVPAQNATASLQLLEKITSDDKGAWIMGQISGAGCQAAIETIMDTLSL
jgi:hypothetical protein